jgi:hypothetical protein
MCARGKVEEDEREGGARGCDPSVEDSEEEEEQREGVGGESDIDPSVQ